MENKDLEKETKNDLQPIERKIRDQDAALDEAAAGGPKDHSAILEDPASFLDPTDPMIRKRKKSPQDTWDVAEGNGPHDASINDNDSANGPAR